MAAVKWDARLAIREVTADKSPETWLLIEVVPTAFAIKEVRPVITVVIYEETDVYRAAILVKTSSGGLGVRIS